LHYIIDVALSIFGVLLNDADWKFNLPEQALNAVLADAHELRQRDGEQRTVTII
jgi:hypothetical protein